MRKALSFLLPIILTLLISILLPDPNLKLKINNASNLNSFQVGVQDDVALMAHRIWPVVRTDLGKRNAIFCIKSGSDEKGLIGVAERELKSKKHKALSLIISEKCDLGYLNLQPADMVTTRKSKIPFLNFGQINVIANQSTVEELTIKLLAANFNNSGAGQESGFINSKNLISKLFTEITNTKQQLDRSRLKAQTNTLWHLVIWFIAVWALVEMIRISPRFKRQSSDDKTFTIGTLYSELVFQLPTIGLIGTMVGLVYTLQSFVTRGSLDVVTAEFSNSAALGGIILALTTTILAAFLGLLITAIFAPALRVEFQEK